MVGERETDYQPTHGEYRMYTSIHNVTDIRVEARTSSSSAFEVGSGWITIAVTTDGRETQLTFFVNGPDDLARLANQFGVKIEEAIQ